MTKHTETHLEAENSIYPMPNQPNIITILHFNDVYNVEPREIEPSGGAARFSHAFKSFLHLNPLILFSGDIFSPSILSTFTKGEQMSKILNELGTHCAVFGNHDFDFGLETLAQRVNETNFPWLMSNVIDNETGLPLGNGKVTHVIDWNGKRIGLIGLVEQDWIETLATVKAEDVTFLDFVEVAQKLSSQLKREGCDYVIALTHMRTKNDKILAESINEVDLILGGHDHVYEVTKIKGKYIIKSGTDFRQFSKITINFKQAGAISIEEVNIVKSVPEDIAVKTMLEQYDDIVKGKMSEILGRFSVPLEGRFVKVRTEESNLGNWICDILLEAAEVDVVILNSGTFRSDQIHEAGDFTLGDLMRVIPLLQETVKLKVTGKTILQALENSVSKYPELEGRFPQIAGAKFAFDPTAPPGKRVDPLLVRVGNEFLVPERTYTLATKQYVYSGCDGYTMFQNCEVLVGPEISPELGLTIRNHFDAVKSPKACKIESKNTDSLITTCCSEVETNGHANISLLPNCTQFTCTYNNSLSCNNQTSVSVHDVNQEICSLSPKVENRIIKINNDQIRKTLYAEREKLLSGSVTRKIQEINILQNGSAESDT